MACTTGTPRLPRAVASQARPSSAADPDTRTVVITASGCSPREQVEGLDPAVGVRAQAVAPDRRDRGPPGLEGGAEVVDEAGVAGDQVGPVEEDRHTGGRASSGRRCRVGGGRHPVAGTSAGGSNPNPVMQHGVGDEAQQVLEVGQAAVHQVLEGLGDGGARHRRGRGQLGVGRGLAAEGQQRDAGGPAAAAQLVERPGPGAGPAEQADQDHLDAVEVGTGPAPVAGGGPHRREAVGSPSTRERRARISLGALVRNRITAVAARDRADRADRAGPAWAISRSRAARSRCASRASARRSKRASRAAANDTPARHPARPGPAGHGGQEGRAEGVALEQAVQAGAERSGRRRPGTPSSPLAGPVEWRSTGAADRVRPWWIS